MATPDDLITPKKAASILGVSSNTFRRYIRLKLIRSYTVAGVRKRVSERDVRALIVADQDGENEQEEVA